MKKKICDLKPGTPFKYKGQVLITDVFRDYLRLTDGEFISGFGVDSEALVTVCKRIRKSDIKERK